MRFSSEPLGRTALASLAGAFVLSFAYIAAYSHAQDIVVDPAVGYATVGPILEGLHQPEQARDGTAFAWTSGSTALNIPDLDRRVAWQLTLRIASGPRPRQRENPTLTLAADGATLVERVLEREARDEIVVIPPTASRGLHLQLATTPPFVPGPHDPRELGATLLRMTLVPVGQPLPSSRSFAAALLVGATIGMVLGAATLPAWLAISTLASIAGLFAWTNTASWVAHTPQPVAMASLIVAVNGSIPVWGLVNVRRSAALRTPPRIDVATASAISS